MRHELLGNRRRYDRNMHYMDMLDTTVLRAAANQVVAEIDKFLRAR